MRRYSIGQSETELTFPYAFDVGPGVMADAGTWVGSTFSDPGMAACTSRRGKGISMPAAWAASSLAGQSAAIDSEVAGTAASPV